MDPSKEELEEIKKKQNTELIDEPSTAGKQLEEEKEELEILDTETVQEKRNKEY